MRLASCIGVDGERFAGRIDGDVVTPLAGLAELGPDTLPLALGEPTLDRRRARPLEDVRLRPLVPAPDKVLCLGLNYHAHVTETRRELPEYPVLFCKFGSSLIGAHDDVVKPPESDEVDFEAEMAVVIGRPVRRVAPDRALDAVAGFAVANDVTVRDFQYKTTSGCRARRGSTRPPWGRAS